MLNYLRIRNFQKHAAFSHHFVPGLTVCVGPNWSGKSTLLRAIVYALYGSSALKLGAKHLSTRQQAEPFHVELGFTVQGVAYHLERGPSRAQLTSQGKLIATGQTGVTAAVEALIGSARTFTSYQVAWQGEASALLTLGSSKLSQHINAVTGVDLVDRVLDLIKEERSNLQWAKRRQLALAEQLAPEAERLEDLTTRWRETSGEIRSARNSSLRYRQAALDRYSSYEAVSQRYHIAAAWEQQEARRQAELSAAQTSLQRAETALAGCTPGAVDQALATLLELESRLVQRRQQEHRQEELRRRIKHLTEQLRMQPRGAPLDVESLRQAQRQAVEAERAAKAELAAQEALVAGSVCPTCKRPFGDDSHLPSPDALDQLRQRVTRLSRQASEHETAVADAEQYNQALTVAQTMIDELAGKKQELAEVQAALSAVKEVSARDLSAARIAHTNAVRAEANYQTEQRIKEEALREIAMLRDPAPAVPACSRQDVEQAALAYQTAYSLHQEAEAALQDARSRYSGLRDRLRDTRVRVWSIKREAASAALEAQRDHALGELGKYLRYNRDRFTKSAWDALLAYASDFVRQASDGAISALQRDEQGDFTFIEGGESMPLELASGMQLAILGVGVKLALGAAIGSNFDVLLLDEVSAAASDENALRLTECLAATGQQVLLISHRMADTVPAHDVIALAA